MPAIPADSLGMCTDADRQMDSLTRRASSVNHREVIEAVRAAPDVPPCEGDELPEEGSSVGMSR